MHSLDTTYYMDNNIVNNLGIKTGVMFESQLGQQTHFPTSELIFFSFFFLLHYTEWNQRRHSISDVHVEFIPEGTMPNWGIIVTNIDNNY